MDQAENSYQLTFYNEKNPWYFPYLFPLYLTVSSFFFILIFHFTVTWTFWFIPLMLLAEIYRIVFFTISLYCTRTLQYAHFRPLTKKSTVDVLIPTLNESRAIVEATARGALKIRGVNNVFVLDDGNRPEIKQMAEYLGVAYGTRRSNLHAKAGNMNFGLSMSTAEFVITLDADHIPNPEFIERTVGYFDDPKLAFIQTPQSFYNTNSIQHRVIKEYPLWNEQTMFYESIQPAKNAFNAAFFCGSSAIIRRKAIDSVGGFATGTATEDIHTSIRIHSKGWKSLFINERLAFGLAAEDLKEYHKQRVRWGAGSLGLLFRTKDSPFIIKNLTIMQRLGYINSTLAYLQGQFKLFYYLLPIFIIFSPVRYISVAFIPYLLLYIPYLIASFWITKVYSRNTYHPIYTEQYNIANIFANIQAMKGIWKVQKKFPVAIKIKHAKENSPVFYTLVAIGALMVIAELQGVSIFVIGMHTNLHLLLQSTLIVGLFWNACNIVIFATFLSFLYDYNYQNTKSTREDSIYDSLKKVSPSPLHVIS